MDDTVIHIRWLMESNYEVFFPHGQLISERVIFPLSQNESNGVEDARFVRFVDDDGSVTYYATYTAYNGREILPQMIETKDFHRFKILTLNGAMARNKGMALFPRRIDGQYAMITRSDGENLYLSYSRNIHFWHDGVRIEAPENPWELVQIGNCGSPLETEKGWLLLTHGVGPMRKYCIGVSLLDLKDPAKTIGRLELPLLAPREWADPSSRWATLAHEIMVGGAWQYAGDDRLIPHAKMVAGGLYSVRGYPESIVSGDSAIFAQTEYRFHVPRAINPNTFPKGDGKAETTRNILGKPFNVLPRHPYGQADWDLILRAFFDVARTVNTDAIAGVEHNETLAGTGLGAELKLYQNVSLRLDWGVPLISTKDGAADAGVQRIHVSVTFVY